MTGPGPHSLPFLPAYIPDDVDIAVVNADVGDDGVSAPAQYVAGLRDVVADAKANGIELKIVVIDRNPPIEAPLRDVASEVGHIYPGSTVLALSPSFAGSYSPAYDRVVLEAGEDVAKTGDPVQSSKNFVSELGHPAFPWTTMTIGIVVVVAAAAVVTRLLQIRARRAALDEAPETTH